MFDYCYDSDSGGLILSFNNGAKSIRSARPVFAEEMVMYGFDRYFKFDPDEKRPYMWVELNSYYYRGVKIARVTGGDLNSDPVLTVYKDLLTAAELEPIDVDLMNKRNDEQLNFLYATTVARLEDFIDKSHDTIKHFYASYSGGKDSDVVLDLIAQSRYAHDVDIVYCDTDMEALETYKHVVQVAKRCEDAQIPFHFAGSHLNSFDSWKLFAPPSRVCRWCCTVHKSTPIALRMKSVGGVGKTATFVGVRWEESPKRSTYDFVSDDIKINGQTVFYPILDWSLSELWMYILRRNIPVCSLYRNGFRRIGCIVCSQAAGRGDWVSKERLRAQVDPYKKIIIESDTVLDTNNPESYWKSGGWHNRQNGFYVRGNRKRKEYDQTETHYIVRMRFAEDTLDEWRKIVGGGGLGKMEVLCAIISANRLQWRRNGTMNGQFIKSRV